jgi:hypothetical protein
VPIGSGPLVEVDALLAYCQEDVPGSKGNRDLGLQIRRATGSTEPARMLGLTVGQLRGRVLVFEFRPEGLDVVLAEPDSQREVFRYQFPANAN